MSMNTQKWQQGFTIIIHYYENTMGLIQETQAELILFVKLLWC